MPKLSFQYVRQGQEETLIAFLERRFKYHSVAEWQALINKGFVKVNGRKRKPGHILQTRHKIIYEPPPRQEPPVDGHFRVLYEDTHILVVSKSGNIPTSPSGKYWHNSLVHLLQRNFANPHLHAVHRLDRETSGINVFAKGKAVAGLLGGNLRDGSVAKEYTAILQGQLPAGETEVSAPLGDDPHSSVHIKQAVRADGRPSRTRFVLRARLPGASLVTIRPYTGRTHQIRVHAAYLGYPVWGDKLYGVPEAAFLDWIDQGARTSENRQLLHASALHFTHPVTQHKLSLYDAPKGLLALFYASMGGGTSST